MEQSIAHAIFIIGDEYASELLDAGCKGFKYNRPLLPWVQALEDEREAGGSYAMRDKVTALAETLEASWAMMDKQHDCFADICHGAYSSWDFGWVPAMLEVAGSNVLTWNAADFARATNAGIAALDRIISP